MGDAGRRISVSRDEFFLLWWAAGGGEPPTVLDVAHVGRTTEDRARHAEEASKLLYARGLGTVHDPAPDLAGLLHGIANAAVTVDLRGYGAHGARRVLGTLGRKNAVVAARGEDRIRLGRVSRTTLIESMLGVLPPLVAGPGGSVNVARTDFDRACAEGEPDGLPGFLNALLAAGVRGVDASTLARLFDSREGGGQLGVTARDHGGQRVRGPGPLTWLDTPTGRYALRQRGGWLTATPATPHRLVSTAEELLTEVRDASPANSVA